MELPAIQEQDTRVAGLTDGQGLTKETAGPPEHLVTSRERQLLAKVCWLLHDAGTLALRTTFDSIHPPLTLPDHLQYVHVKSVLQKLHQQNVLSDKQWRQLYPPRKKKKRAVVNSQNFDTEVLVVLLQTICHLTPPYPHGWHNEPLPADSSLSADVVRLQLKLQEVGALSGLRQVEFPVIWQQSVQVLQRLCNQEVRVKIQRIEGESLQSEQASKYINLIKGAWAPAETQAMLAKLKELENQRRRGSGSKSAYRRKEGGGDEGIPPEDKVVIDKCFKLLQDNVLAEDILDRLLQGQVIKVNDKQEIMAASKNSDRMQVLLPKVMKSPMAYAFKLLCDAIKFKYPRVHEQVMRTRKAVYKQGLSDTIDYVGVCREGLQTHYKEVFSELHPLPWSDVTCSVKDMYCQLDIVDIDGHKVSLPELLPARTQGSRGPRVVIEGFAGSGKTTLASTLAYTWAIQPSYFPQQYTFLLLLDAQTIKLSLREEIYEQLLPQHFKVTDTQFWSLVENNASDVLLVVDGWEGGQGGPELTQIIQGCNMRGCAVLILVRPQARVDNFVKPDYKLYNLGFKSTTVNRCLQNYMRLLDDQPGEEEIETTETPEMTLPDDLPLKSHLTTPYICSLALATIRVHGLDTLREITTLAGLFEQYLVTMATLYCTSEALEVEGSEFPEQVTRTVGQLETFAFHSLTTRSFAFSEEELADPVFTQLGVLTKAGTGLRWKFVCSLLRDFLAARYLADLPSETMISTLDTFNFLKSPRTAHVLAFACGLYRNDYTTQTLAILFREMAKHNSKRCKNVSFREAQDGRGVDTVNSGAVQSYSHSLMALAECQGREDMIALLAPSFPRLIQLCGDGIVSRSVIEGLNYMLADSRVSVTNVEINLVPLHMKQSQIYLSLAEALTKATHLKTLTIAWSSIELMAEFLKTALAGHPPLSTLRVEDCTKKAPRSVDAATWAYTQEFCACLTQVRLFSFIHCKSSSLSCQVIRSLPTTLQILDLTQCPLNRMCADELGKTMEQAEKTTTLKLTDTQLTTSDLAALMHGLKQCSCLQHLVLSGLRFDRTSLSHLIEYLRLNSTLQVLDLSRTSLTFDMCAALASALTQTHSLKRLVLESTAIPKAGQSTLHLSAADKVFLQGLEIDLDDVTNDGRQTGLSV